MILNTGHPSDNLQLLPLDTSFLPTPPGHIFPSYTPWTHLSFLHPLDTSFLPTPPGHYVVSSPRTAWIKNLPHGQIHTTPSGHIINILLSEPSWTNIIYPPRTQRYSTLVTPRTTSNYSSWTHLSFLHPLDTMLYPPPPRTAWIQNLPHGQIHTTPSGHITNIFLSEPPWTNIIYPPRTQSYSTLVTPWIGVYYNAMILELCATHLTMCAWVQTMHFGCRTYIPIFEFTPSYLQNSINSDSAIYPAADAPINVSQR